MPKKFDHVITPEETEALSNKDLMNYAVWVHLNQDNHMLNHGGERHPFLDRVLRVIKIIEKERITEFFKNSIHKGVRFDSTINIDFKTEKGNFENVILSYIFYKEDEERFYIYGKRESDNYRKDVQIPWEGIDTTGFIIFEIEQTYNKNLTHE